MLSQENIDCIKATFEPVLEEMIAEAVRKARVRYAKQGSPDLRREMASLRTEVGALQAAINEREASLIAPGVRSKIEADRALGKKAPSFFDELNRRLHRYRKQKPGETISERASREARDKIQSIRDDGGTPPSFQEAYDAAVNRLQAG